MSDYWAQHRTIVITWPPNMPGVFASARWRRHSDGSLSVEYTREELELAIGGAHVSSQLSSHRRPTPDAEPEPVAAAQEPARLVFTRLSQRDGRKLAQQAQAAETRQEALL